MATVPLFTRVRQMNAHTIICTSCGVERTLKNADSMNRFIYTVLIGKCEARCKSCSVTGRKYPQRAGKGFSPQAKAAQRQAVLGNKWAVGTQYSDEERERRRQVMLGNKFNPGLRGELSPSWKGGLRSERSRAMGRIEYKAWRSAVFARDNYTCQVCDQYGGHLHADHIKSWAEHPELRYDVNNGRTLCRACHFYMTFKRKMETTSRWGLTSQEK